MRGVKTKSNIRWKRLALFMFLFLLSGLLVNSVNNVYKKKKGAEEAFNKMSEEISTLKIREEFLDNSLRKLATPEGIEFEIRKKLNVAEAGESVAIIVQEEVPTTTKKEEVSFWQKFKGRFGF